MHNDILWRKKFPDISQTFQVQWHIKDFSHCYFFYFYLIHMFISMYILYIHILIHISIYLVSMLSIYLYQSFPSGMSSDILLSVRTCLNIPHKNSTFFSLSLYCLIFVFSTNTCQNKNCTGQKSCWQKWMFLKLLL